MVVIMAFFHACQEPSSQEFKCATLFNSQIPGSTFNYFDGEKQMQEVTTDELCSGKKVCVPSVRSKQMMVGHKITRNAQGPLL